MACKFWQAEAMADTGARIGGGLGASDEPPINLHTPCKQCPICIGHAKDIDEHAEVLNWLAAVSPC